MIIGKKNQGFGIYLGPHLYLFPFFKSMKMARKKVYWEFFIWDILNVRHYKPCTRGCLISTQCCKYQNRHSSKNIWVIKLTFLPKWSPDWRIILGKYQPGHSYTFWTMPILIFSPVYLFLRHPLVQFLISSYVFKYYFQVFIHLEL